MPEARRSRSLRVYVGGTFDLFHAGHVEMLRRAATYGQTFVAVNTDRYVEALKGRPPVMTLDERLATLRACVHVDYAFPNDGEEAKLVELFKPDVLIYGNDGNWTRDSYLALFDLDEQRLVTQGIDLIFLPRTEGVSSTDIVRRIEDRKPCCGSCAQPGEATGLRAVPEQL